MHSWKSIVAICSSRLCIIVNGVSDRNQMVIVLKLSKFAESVYDILHDIVLCCSYFLMVFGRFYVVILMYYLFGRQFLLKD